MSDQKNSQSILWGKEWIDNDYSIIIIYDNNYIILISIISIFIFILNQIIGFFLNWWISKYFIYYSC